MSLNLTNKIKEEWVAWVWGLKLSWLLRKMVREEKGKFLSRTYDVSKLVHMLFTVKQ